jgi:hypothetical protein
MRQELWKREHFETGRCLTFCPLVLSGKGGVAGGIGSTLLEISQAACV